MVIAELFNFLLLIRSTECYTFISAQEKQLSTSVCAFAGTRLHIIASAASILTQMFAIPFKGSRADELNPAEMHFMYVPISSSLSFIHYYCCSALSEEMKGCIIAAITTLATALLLLYVYMASATAQNECAYFPVFQQADARQRRSMCLIFF
jgi:hypothetical protein